MGGISDRAAPVDQTRVICYNPVAGLRWRTQRPPSAMGPALGELSSINEGKEMASMLVLEFPPTGDSGLVTKEGG
jgi:hypothetical protein